MLTDHELCNLLQEQYDGIAGVFDIAETLAGVTYGVKFYPDCTVVAFEGSHNLPDWISNFAAVMMQVPDFAGVEQGFYSGLPEVFTSVAPKVDKSKRVYVTGHSRGAAHAHIFAAIMIKQGYQVEVVAFGSPRPGDAQLAAILAKAPNRSYRNYHDFDEQDYVCDVPFDITLVAPFKHPGKQIVVDVAPHPDDPWLILSRHHLFLYAKALGAL